MIDIYEIAYLFSIVVYIVTLARHGGLPLAHNQLRYWEI